MRKEANYFPRRVMLLSFNYTPLPICTVISTLNTTSFMVNWNTLRISSFGYGDELDKHYQDILDRNDNELLKNVKSVKYLETRHYKDMLEFLMSAPFQVMIMGHSCGILIELCLTPSLNMGIAFR